jgi:hypothetical protein
MGRMKYPEEDIARQLHRELLRRFGELSPTVAGAGVHWRCTVSRDERKCEISCFALRSHPEYFTSFEQRSETVAYARVPSTDDTIAAVADWLNGADLPQLYDRYRFIDAGKRTLEQIRDAVTAAEPELRRLAETELRLHIVDAYTLFFRGEARSCEVSFYGKNEWPDAEFSWDACPLFHYQPHDAAQFAAVLNCWICETLMPSEMRSRFPWLTIGELADYYEAGRPIEGEFIQSWEAMERFYHDRRFPLADVVKAFMQSMRSRGYHKTLRAGQSLWSLILSRSRRHGLRDEQPCIQFWFHADGMVVINCLEDRRNGIRSVYAKIECTSEIEALLNQLAASPID